MKLRFLLVLLQRLTDTKSWFVALLPAESPAKNELEQSGFIPAKAASLEGTTILNLENSSLVLQQQLENSPLRADSTAPLRLRIYQADGRKGGFFPLLDIQAPAAAPG